MNLLSSRCANAELPGSACAAAGQVAATASVPAAPSSHRNARADLLLDPLTLVSPSYLLTGPL